MDYSLVSQDNASNPNQVQGKALTKRKSKLEIYLPILVPCFVVILILIILAGIWHSQLETCKKYCKTTECIITSGEILKMSNLEADPCNDFHEFACGKFDSNALLKPESGILTSFSELVEENLLKMYKLLTDNNFTLKGVNSSAVLKVKNLFSSCMDTGNIEKQGRKLLEFINQMNGWPLLEGSQWNESAWLLNDALSFSNKLGVFPFFRYDVLPNFINSSEFELKFSGVDLSYNKNVYNKSGDEGFIYKQALVDYICSVAKLLGATKNVTQEAEEIWNLEQNMGNVLVEFMPQRELFTINRTTVAMANKMLGDWINLEKLLTEVFGQTIISSDKIMVASEKYLEAIGKLIKQTDKRIQANYVVWMNINKLIPFLSDSFRSAEHSFKKVSIGQVASKPRWKSCIILSIDTVGYALSALFIEQYFVETAKNQVEEIFNLVKAVFEKRLRKVSWLDEETRSEALKKINKLKKSIGYPDFIKDAALLDDYYKQLAINKNYFDNAINIAAFENYKTTSKYGKQRDKQEWLIPPIEYNAYYDRTSNEMVLLAGLLQKPLFSEVFPKSFNFGRVGFIIGHEIIHGFDSLGRHFNSDGNLVNWWSSKSESEFNKKSECFVEQYNSFNIFGHNSSGLKTLPEDIADNCGLSLAYFGYKEWLKNNDDLLLPGLSLTHEQQFFLSFGQYLCAHYRKEKALELMETDDHSNNKIRIIGTIQNSHQFAETFKCKKNSPMNPSKKCSIW